VEGMSLLKGEMVESIQKVIADILKEMQNEFKHIRITLIMNLVVYVLPIMIILPKQLVVIT